MIEYTIVRCGMSANVVKILATSPECAMMLIHTKYYADIWMPPTLDSYSNEWIVEAVIVESNY
jgi:hypothetical protein